MRLNNSFQDKIVLITGGSSGIGQALACSLAALGSHVWLLARGKDRLAEALESVRLKAVSLNQRFGMTAADVSDYKQVEAAVRQVEKQLGTPDLIINSAGVTHPGYIQDMDLDIFRSMMEINYFGTLYTVKAALPGMIMRGSGHIVNISSSAGFVGVFGYSAYSPSKFAVTGFSETLRAEMKPHGIRVSVVFPPDTDTPQLAYENQIKPPETKAISGNVKCLSAEKVAEEILKGVSKGKFTILPGFDNKLAYHLNHAAGNLLAYYMDYCVSQSQKHIRRDNQNRLVKP